MDSGERALRLPGGGACAVGGHWLSGGGVSGPCPSPRRATVHPPPSRWLPTGSPAGVSPPRAAAAVFLPSHFFPIFLFFFALPQPQLLLFRQRLLGPRRPSRVLPKVVRRVGHAGPRGGGWAAAPSPAAGTSCPCTPDRSSWVPGLSWGADRGCSPGLPIGVQASPSVRPPPLLVHASGLVRVQAGLAPGPQAPSADLVPLDQRAGRGSTCPARGGACSAPGPWAPCVVRRACWRWRVRHCFWRMGTGGGKPVVGGGSVWSLARGRGTSVPGGSGDPGV